MPASGFHEWTGGKGHKQCYNIHPVNSAIAFAGLCELWDFQGEVVPSFTIITLPPHPRFSHIHPKSIPLMLKAEDFDMWLDPHLTNTDPLQHLLGTRIREPLLVEPVKSPGSLEKAGPGEEIAADEL
ncbi:SOS response-associated peptidase family protein [Marinobacter azerbaijanicus]|uniref:SOS response-associated peptidase family protein n=1 Tax=Marinobacter azerbaijanicus TaxID=3050455 RepID=UPI003BF5052F